MIAQSTASVFNQSIQHQEKMESPMHQQKPNEERQEQQSRILSYLPTPCVPYAELVRLDKPLACLYLYFPCAFGTLLVASMATRQILPLHLARTNLMFFVGCFLVRCAGCSWNDIVDQDLDRLTTRTRHRPLARRALSTSSALIFALIQVILGYMLVYALMPRSCLYFSIPSAILTALYPFGKRFTHYPQLILGCVGSWGVIMAFPALGLDLLSEPEFWLPASALYLSCIAWTVFYDTIYAAQDLKDDLKTGIKSPVVQYREQTRHFIVAAAALQVILLISTGIAMGANTSYFLLTCGLTTICLGAIVTRVDLSDPQSCIGWFKKGSVYTGATILSGFCVLYAQRVTLEFY